MFYLILCDTDSSYCTVEDFEIVCDIDQPPEINDHVQFFYGNDKYSGTVIDLSDDPDALKAKAKKLKQKRSPPSSLSQPSLPAKRPRKAKKPWSFYEKLDNSDITNQKKAMKSKKNSIEVSTGLQQQVKDAIKSSKILTEVQQKKSASVTDGSIKKKSPTKEELKKILEHKERLLASYESSTSMQTSPGPSYREKYVISDEDNNSNDNSSDNDDVKDKSNESFHNDDSLKNELFSTKQLAEKGENLNPQLYGKDCGEKMVLLKNNIYCKQVALDDAIGASRKSATSFLRRLMDGVFKREAILKCTFSGRPPSAQGKDRQSVKVEALDRTAKKAIIDFCKEYAIKERWPESNEGQLQVAMSQWLGEQKRAYKMNLDRNT